jgi:DNA ligase (NAD+)
MGRTGVLTPVAVYKDVEIDGAICNRANLHNLNIMDELLGVQPYIGQKIWVYKANQIIPQISKTKRRELSMDMTFFLTPDSCPICFGDTNIQTSNSGTQELYCTNPQCPGKLVNKLDHFCGKKGLDIKGLSKATLEKLIEWGWVSCVSDIFKLGQVSDLWASKPGFGPKSVDNLLNAIYAARKCTLEAYIGAWGIPLIGRTYARKLASEFYDYDEFRDNIVGGFDFTSLEGFGPEKHDALVKFDFTEADSLVDRGIITFIKEEAPLENSGNALQGATVCITGKLRNFKNRDELKMLIERAGGKVTSAVSSKTNYLVNNDINSTSSKNATAKSLGIPIITEEEIINMLSN